MIATTTHEIKTYSPEFLDEEVKLTQDFEKRLHVPEIYQTFRDETQVDNTKNFRENGVPNFPFIPTDHWYLFDEKDGMVGYIHAFPQKDTKRCSMSIVVTKEGHEKGGQILFDTLLNSVKERGYDTLVKNATVDHQTELDFLKQFGFKKAKLRNLRAEVPIGNLKITKNDKYEIQSYDSKYREKIITDLYLPRGYKRQLLDAQFDNLEKMKADNKLPSWVIALENGEVVGQSVGYNARPGLNHLIQFNTVTTNLEGDESLPLINAVYGSHLENIPKETTHIEHVLFNQVLHLRPTYEKLGFKYLENHTYEKSI